MVGVMVKVALKLYKNKIKEINKRLQYFPLI